MKLRIESDEPTPTHRVVWDYAVVKTFNLNHVELQTRGEQGWELASATYIEKEYYWVFIYKRPRVEATS